MENKSSPSRHMSHGEPGLLRHVLTRNYFSVTDDVSVSDDSGIFSSAENSSLDETEVSSSNSPTVNIKNSIEQVLKDCTKTLSQCEISPNLRENDVHKENDDLNHTSLAAAVTNLQQGILQEHPTSTPFNESNLKQQNRNLLSSFNSCNTGQPQNLPASPLHIGRRLSSRLSLGSCSLSPFPTPESKKVSPLVQPIGLPSLSENKSNTSRTLTSLKSNLFGAGVHGSPAKVGLVGTQKLVRRSDLKFGDIIGRGAFGSVHEGTLKGQPVAIKVVNKRRGSGIHREIVQAERLAFTLGLRHKHIVSVLSVNVCDGPRGDALIIMELVKSRTLQACLDDVTELMTRQKRLCFAVQITEALQYLHSKNLAHLDVKPKNVLVTSSNCCKLADFGNLTNTSSDGPMEDPEFTQLLGTLPYRAPELMQGKRPTSKADVFSLAVTLWQLATRKTPHEGVSPHQLIYLVVKRGMRPQPHDTDNDVIEELYRDLYTSCWSQCPDKRPTSSQILTKLHELSQ